MFRNWGFLLGEIWVLILLAALLGLLAGWLIWGRRSSVTVQGDASGLRADLHACHRLNDERAERIAALEAAEASHARTVADLETQLASVPASAAVSAAAAIPEAEDTEEAPTGVDYDGDGVIEGADEGTKPMTLDAPRDGFADDLKQVKGIGPQLEKLCNSLGFYHFDQIAAWTSDEVAWVDANLEGFKGRVTRDNWVEQAKVLAAGGSTEFSDRVKDGDVY